MKSLTPLLLLLFAASGSFITGCTTAHIDDATKSATVPSSPSQLPPLAQLVRLFEIRGWKFSLEDGAISTTFSLPARELHVRLDTPNSTNCDNPVRIRACFETTLDEAGLCAAIRAATGSHLRWENEGEICGITVVARSATDVLAHLARIVSSARNMGGWRPLKKLALRLPQATTKATNITQHYENHI